MEADIEMINGRGPDGFISLEELWPVMEELDRLFLADLSSTAPGDDEVAVVAETAIAVNTATR